MSEEEILQLGDRAAAAVMRYARTGERPSPEEAREIDLWNAIVFERQVALCPALLDLIADLATTFPPPPTPAEA